MSRSLTLSMRPGKLILTSDLFTGKMARVIPLDTSQWNHIRLTSLGSPDPVVRLYINGVQVAVIANTDAIVSGSDSFLFAALGGTSGTSNVYAFEYYAYVSSVAATVYPVVQAAPATTGQIDDWLAVSEQLSSVVVTSLGSNAASSVYRNDYKRGLQLPMGLGMGYLSGAASSQLGSMEAYFVSDGLTQLDLGVTGQISTSLTPAYLYTFNLIEVGPSSTSDILQGFSGQYTAAGVSNTFSLAAQRCLAQGVYRLILNPATFNAGADTITGEIVPHITKRNEVL